VVRGLEHVDPATGHSQHALEPRPFEVARQQDCVAGVAYFQHKAAGVLVVSEAGRRRVQHFYRHLARGQVVARLDDPHGNAALAEEVESILDAGRFLIREGRRAGHLADTEEVG
jgi:hypothetical protein